MPKVILEFNLPEEKDELYNAQNGHLYALVLYDLDMYLRELYKYKDIETINIVELRDKINELCNEYDVSKI